MKFALTQLIAAALVATGACADLQPLVALRGSSSPDVADAPALALGNQCVKLGETAAELIVKDEWCKPDGSSAYSDSDRDWRSDCRQAAYGVCKGAIVDVQEDWCPKKTFKTSQLLDLQDMCEDQVNDMVGYSDDDDDNNREPDDCGRGGGCGSCKQKYCPDPTERKECKAKHCSLMELAAFPWIR